MPREDYLKFTYDWLGLCIQSLRPWGSLWVNIPDDSAAEIVVHLKQRGLEMENWCIWHYRFGQNTKARFINSKVHALWFIKPGVPRPPASGPCETPTTPHTWNPQAVLEPSDRAT